jgi:hypothetical protein
MEPIADPFKVHCGIMKQPRTRQSPSAGKVSVKVHATLLPGADLEWFTTFNPAFGEPR